MRKSTILVAALAAICPVIALAQSDPDWSRREMERMQTEQERFNAQVERQRAEQERFNAQVERQRAEQARMQAQQERQAAQVARQRAEQERGAARQRGGGTSATTGATPMRGEEMDRRSRPITSERLNVVFKVATHVCPVSQGPVPLNLHAFEDAISLMSDDESGLLLYFCTMYSLGQVAGEDATKRTRAKQ